MRSRTRSSHAPKETVVKEALLRDGELKLAGAIANDQPLEDEAGSYA